MLDVIKRLLQCQGRSVTGQSEYHLIFTVEQYNGWRALNLQVIGQDSLGCRHIFSHGYFTIAADIDFDAVEVLLHK